MNPGRDQKREQSLRAKISTCTFSGMKSTEPHMAGVDS